VGFNIGGNGDMIDHQINGYLARPFDPIDLARGIDLCLNKENAKQLREDARKKIIQSFDAEFVIKRYIKIYSDIFYKKH
jgi:glycosyltransferase involved in cell wall biosynthesis